jgi:hypothetical protein
MQWRTSQAIAKWVALLSLTGAYGWLVWPAASDRALWLDEIFTVYVARAPDVATVIARLRDGMDNHPPLHYLLVHSAGRVLGPGELAARVPAMAAVWVALIATFEVVRRRHGVAPALLAGSVLLTSAAGPFATEARGYGLLLGSSALALAVWLDGERRGRAGPVVLFLAMSAQIWCHYYGVVMAAPLLAGELVRRRSEVGRPARWLVVMAAALANVLLVAPFARSAGASYAGGFWTDAGPPGNLLSGYATLVGGSVAWIPALALASFITGRGGRPVSLPRRHEAVALLGFALTLPAIWLLASAVTHAFHHKYALAAVLPWAWLAGTAGAAAARPLGVTAVAGLLLAAAPWLAEQARDPRQAGSVDRVIAFDARAAQLGEEQQLPIVFDGPFDFIRAHHYGDDSLRARALFVTDREGDRRLTGSDTIAVAFANLARHVPLHLMPYRDLVARQERFLLFSSTRLPGTLLPRLTGSGHDVRLLTRIEGVLVYRVELGGSPASR